MTEDITNVTLVAERVGIGIAVGEKSEMEIRLCGTSPEYLRLLADATKAEVARGRFLTDADVQNNANVVVIGEALAERLFGLERAIDQGVRIGTEEFTVVGVVNRSRKSYLGDVTCDAYIPIGAFDRDRLQLEEYSAAELDRIWVNVDSLVQVPATQEIIRNLLQQRHPEIEFAVR
jgi:putative ABC transport system permease protein